MRAPTTVILTPADADDAGIAVGAARARAGNGVVLGACCARPAFAARRSRERATCAPLRWVLFAGETFPGRHLRRLREQLPVGAIQSRLRLDRGQRLHLLPPARRRTFPPVRCRSAVRARRRARWSPTLHMQPVADGEVGDLFVRGSTVMSGYWDGPGTQRAGARAPARRRRDRRRVLPHRGPGPACCRTATSRSSPGPIAR